MRGAERFLSEGPYQLVDLFPPEPFGNFPLSGGSWGLLRDGVEV